MGTHTAANRHETLLGDKGLVVILTTVRTATAVLLRRWHFHLLCLLLLLLIFLIDRGYSDFGGRLWPVLTLLNKSFLAKVRTPRAVDL